MTTSLLIAFTVLTQFVLSIIFISISCAKKKTPPPATTASPAAANAAANGEPNLKTCVLAPDSKEPVPPANEPKDKSKEEKKEEKKGEAPAEKAEEKKDGAPKGTPKDEKKSEDKKEDTPKADELSNKNKPYPEVKEPTKSELQKKKEAMDKEKKDKINKGQYQTRSDEDDTLEKVKSLNEEQTEKSVKKKKP